jgi:hypothetical protein
MSTVNFQIISNSQDLNSIIREAPSLIIIGNLSNDKKDQIQRLCTVFDKVIIVPSENKGDQMKKDFNKWRWNFENLQIPVCTPEYIEGVLIYGTEFKPGDMLDRHLVRRENNYARGHTFIVVSYYPPNLGDVDILEDENIEIWISGNQKTEVKSKKLVQVDEQIILCVNPKYVQKDK